MLFNSGFAKPGVILLSVLSLSASAFAEINVDRFPGDGVFYTTVADAIGGEAPGASRVEFWADGQWNFAQASVGSDSRFEIRHQFNTPAERRTLEIRAYDIQGNRLAQFSRPFDVIVGPTLTVTGVRTGQIVRSGHPLRLTVNSERLDSVQAFLDGEVLAEAPAPIRGSLSVSLPAGRLGEATLSIVGFLRGVQKIEKKFTIQIAENPTPQNDGSGFHSYLVRATELIHARYGMLGYDIRAQFTHDLPFSNYGFLKATRGAKTMCVAAMLEVIVTAFNLYVEETGDRTVFEHLPFRSWGGFGRNDIKAHIWVSSSLASYGTADAVTKFGMGEKVSFKELHPGSFINFNRTNGTGHAVLFLSYLDKHGNELPEWSPEVAGFKYYSAQGRSARGQGGMGYKYAFFSTSGCPNIPFPRDCGIRYSENQKILTTGMMWHPRMWERTKSVRASGTESTADTGPATAEPGFVFDGLTTDD